MDFDGFLGLLMGFLGFSMDSLGFRGILYPFKTNSERFGWIWMDFCEFLINLAEILQDFDRFSGYFERILRHSHHSDQFPTVSTQSIQSISLQ